MTEFLGDAIRNITNPFTLAAFTVAVFLLLAGPVLRAVAPRLGRKEAGPVVRLVITRGFWLAIIIALGGFVYAGLRDRIVERSLRTQQTILEMQHLPTLCKSGTLLTEVPKAGVSRFLVAAFQGENPEDKRIGRQFGAAMREALEERRSQLGLAAAEFEVVQLSCYIDSHDLASILTKEAHADAIIWGTSQMAINSDRAVFRAHVTFTSAGQFMFLRNSAWSEPIDELAIRQLDLPSLIIDEPRSLVDFVLGQHFMLRGDLAKAEQLVAGLPEALQSSPEGGESFRYHIGALNVMRGRYSEAETQLRAASNQALRNKNRLILTTIEYTLAILSRRRGSLADAEGHFQRCAEAARELNQDESHATCLFGLAEIDVARGMYDNALERLRGAAEIFQQSQRQLGLADCYRLSGVISHERQDFNAAMEWYEKALAISDTHPANVLTARILQGLGNASIALGKAEAARQYLERSLLLNEQLGQTQDQIGAYHNLGNVAKARGQLEKAESWYTKAKKAADEFGDVRVSAGSRVQLGAVAELHQEPQKAIGLYDEAIALYKGKGFGKELGVTYGRRGYAHHDMGRTSESLQDVLRAAFVLSRTNSPEVTVAMNILQFLRAELGEHFATECEKARSAVREVYGSDTAQTFSEFEAWSEEMCSTN